jgi:two-component system, chemotaxis family, sensor kinase CheA
LNEMFRSAHSLKGLSAMLGLSDINHLTHKIENVFDAARKDELPLNCEIVDLMFQGIDRLGALVNVLKEPDGEAIDCDNVLEGIHRVLESAGVEKQIASQADAEKELSQLTAKEAAGEPEASVESSKVLVAPSAESMDSLSAEQTAEDACADNATSKCDAIEKESCSSAAEIDYFAGIVDETDLQSKYIPIFIDETEISLDSLTEVLLTLEQGGHHAAIEQLLMTSHRIKGSAASIGLNRAAKLAHLMEDLMQDITASGKFLTTKITDALLACIDGMRTYVESLKTGCPRTAHFNSLARELISSLVSAETAIASLPPTRPASPVIEASSTSVPIHEKKSSEASAAWLPVNSTPSLTVQIDEALRRRVREKINDSERELALVGVVSLQPKLPLAGLKGRLLYEKLTNIGEIRYFSPAVERLEEMENLASLEFGVITDRSLEIVKQMLQVGGVTKIEMATLAPRATVSPKVNLPLDNLPVTQNSGPRGDSPADEAASKTAVEQTTAKTGKAASADNGGKPIETLRVDIERLDQLMNLSGQLAINKARFEQIGGKMKKAVGGRPSRNVLNDISAVLTKMIEPGEEGIQHDSENMRSLARRMQRDLEEIRRDVDSLSAVRAQVNDLFETIHLLDRVSDGIQQSVMDTRMLPIGPLFQRFKRVIRDISRTNNKNIRLEINGEKTELDKRMIDELGDPLIHMVRNSADHGIESPEVRRAAGKPEQGTVSLDAFHRGNSIYIRVSDDGKGLDSERIKAKALEKGLIAPAEAERMSKSQIFQLIWEPGLSTAEKVTEVSGRGMGMDIVKSKIELLNGTVELDSEPGRGTTVTIKLPLTLAILPSLMVSIEGDVFAMPLESVKEIVNVSPNDISTVHRRPTARVRGRVVSMVELGSIFSWHGRTDDNNFEKNPAEGALKTLVIVNENGRELGLAVDRVIGEQDIVIKSMAENYRNVQGIAGASILGDGRVSLILDLAAVIDMAICEKT